MAKDYSKNKDMLLEYLVTSKKTNLEVIQMLEDHGFKINESRSSFSPRSSSLCLENKDWVFFVGIETNHKTDKQIYCRYFREKSRDNIALA